MSATLVVDNRWPRSQPQTQPACYGGRFTGRLGTQRVRFEGGVFFELFCTDGTAGQWPCVIRSPLVMPELDAFEAGDPVSVVGNLRPRAYDVNGVTRTAHSIIAIQRIHRSFPQGLRLW
jgi:hypothetical protein